MYFVFRPTGTTVEKRGGNCSSVSLEQQWYSSRTWVEEQTKQNGFHYGPQICQIVQAHLKGKPEEIFETYISESTVCSSDLLEHLVQRNDLATSALSPPSRVARSLKCILKFTLGFCFPAWYFSGVSLSWGCLEVLVGKPAPSMWWWCHPRRNWQHWLPGVVSHDRYRCCLGHMQRFSFGFVSLLWHTAAVFHLWLQSWLGAPTLSYWERQSVSVIRVSEGSRSLQAYLEKRLESKKKIPPLLSRISSFNHYYQVMGCKKMYKMYALSPPLPLIPSKYHILLAIFFSLQKPPKSQWRRAE